MMKRFVLGLWVLMGLGLVGCAAQAPVGPFTLVSAEDAGALGYHVAWIGDLNVPSGTNQSVVQTVGDLLITVESRTHLIAAVRLSDGQVAWRKVVAGGYDDVAGVGDGDHTVVVSTRTDIFQLDDQSGKQMTQVRLYQSVNSPPTVRDRFGIFGGINGLAYSQDIYNGFRRWSYRMTDAILYPPVEEGGIVFVTDRRGVTAALVATTGDVIWRRHPTDAIAAPPVATPDTLYLPTGENKLFAIQRSSNRDRWIFRAQEKLAGVPVIAGNLVLQPLSGNQWAAIDAESGKELWRVHGAYESVVPTARGLLFAGRNELLLIDVATGQTIKQTAARPLVKMLPGPDKSLILVGADGSLMRLDPGL